MHSAEPRTVKDELEPIFLNEEDISGSSLELGSTKDFICKKPNPRKVSELDWKFPIQHPAHLSTQMPRFCVYTSSAHIH